MFKNRYFLNSMWLISDKFFVLLGGLLATTMVAKYLGPEQFGVLSYGITLSMFITVIAQWGASFLVFNLAAKDQTRAEELIESTLLHRISIYLTCSFIISFFLFLRLDYSSAKVISAICFSNIFIGMDIYQYYFNGSLNSRFNTKITFIAKVCSIITKLSFIVFEVKLIYFALPMLFEGLIVFFLKKKKLGIISNYKNISDNVEINNTKVRAIITEGLPYVASSFLVLAYTKANDIILRELTSFIEVGVFSLGVLVSNAWTFIPLAVGTSYLTRAISSGKTEDYAFTYFITSLVSIPILVGIFVFSDIVVKCIFSESYDHLGDIIPILSIGSFFGVLVFLINRQISNFESGGSYLIRKTGLTAVIAVVSSAVLISVLGIYGAVYSWIITQLFGMTLGNIFFNQINWTKLFLSVFNLRVMSRKIINV
ncbi:putative Polysacc_synt_C domain-containing protein [Vibrio chagasii]|nr:putative Polysacc_synt_C domain-containing protein [Vibrio chagasii]CAH6996654.1 putative Polysacc_synt_C domain-containing protein [Vibrio chagasii]CAH7128389.1 putative Polysacc_synt_C domain-containing protein [Vibrio chagasii]CAH7383248.1 putative Polysacc_synt_C domain-containing protein [Vibrio chagasii]